MKVEVLETDDLETIVNLGQLYQYDFTEFIPADIGADGRFTFIPIAEQYAGDGFDRFLIKVDGQLAGFAILSFGGAFRDESEHVWFIDEFFVMRPYRGKGIGERAARELFDSRPGVWEVGQVPGNTPAQAFWRKVIGRYTRDGYEEVHMDDERWTGPVQYFRA